MKLENMLYLVNDINEKFNKFRDGEADHLYYEVLHTSLSIMLSELTEEQYNLIPNPYRHTIEKLENAILQYVSQEYQKEQEDHINEKGKFRRETKKENGMITRCKQKIGFTANLEEGTTI